MYGYKVDELRLNDHTATLQHSLYGTTREMLGQPCNGCLSTRNSPTTHHLTPAYTCLATDDTL